MASQNPSHKSSKPSPLATPLTNPLLTNARRPGEVSSRGLSVHLGVHGRITSNTPNVAHKVTSSSARKRSSHTLWSFRDVFAAASFDGHSCTRLGDEFSSE